MRIGIIVQARMGSTRFPGKVLKEIQGKSLLELQFNRLKRSQKVDTVIIATSEENIDDCIAELCENLGIPCFRGSEKDVLERYYLAAKHYDLDVIIRTNGDCPFIDATVIDKLIGIWQLNFPKLDYVSNILEETFPLGMHIEVFSLSTIKRALDESIADEEREHVTAYIYRNTQKFNVLNVRNEQDLSSYRWTVDYPEDFMFVEEIYKRFSVDDSSFGMHDIVTLLKKEPELMKINSYYKKKQNIL
jgi:spore coat polysaccharide biosynthesis protein SpsF